MAKTNIPGYVAPETDSPDKKPIALYVAIGLLVAVGVGAIIFAGLQSDSGNVGKIEVSPAITVSGEHLPEFPDTGEAIPSQDEAKGMLIPTLSGKDFQDEDVTFAPDGPELRLFLAHWCSHCQAEVPKIVDWMADGTIPDDVQVRAVTTSTDEAQPNYPPSQWLSSEDFTADTMADDSSSSAARAYGLSGFPYFVAIDADGLVVARGSGELEQSQMEQLMALIEAGAAAGEEGVVDAPEDNTVQPGTDVDLGTGS